jgi:hypothetical protein
MESNTMQITDWPLHNFIKSLDEAHNAGETMSNILGAVNCGLLGVPNRLDNIVYRVGRANPNFRGKQLAEMAVNWSNRMTEAKPFDEAAEMEIIEAKIREVKIAHNII